MRSFQTKIAAFALLASLCFATAPAAARSACPGRHLMPSAANVAKVRAATLCLVNRERTKRHLTALRYNPSLAHAARSYARKLVVEGFFDHTAPDGTTMLQRIELTSYLRSAIGSWTVGENLAYGTGELATPASIVKAWMHSPGHRANILNGDFRDAGLGVKLGTPDSADGATYVNEFGRRMR